MGFFSDFKEDLSQGVNELLPGDLNDIVETETGEADEAVAAVEADEAVKTVAAVKADEAVEAAAAVEADEAVEAAAAVETDDRADRQVSDETAVITAGMQIRGDVASKGSLDITGMVEGNIDVWGGLNISGCVIGNITAKSATIAGAVKGDIDVHGHVTLAPSAIVLGNIKSKSIQVDNGAVIEGMWTQCHVDVSPLSFFEEYRSEILNGKNK